MRISKQLRNEAHDYLQRAGVFDGVRKPRLKLRSLRELSDRVSKYAKKVSQNQKEPVMVVGSERTGVHYLWRIPSVEQQLKAQLEDADLKKFQTDVRKNAAKIKSANNPNPKTRHA